MEKTIRIILLVVIGILPFRIHAQKIKVIAYNIEFAKSTSTEEMAAFLKTENADIICFSEVPAQGWTKKVGELLGLSYSFEGKIASANHMEEYKDKTGRYFGKYKSILSKYPLENPHEVLLEGDRWSPASAVVANVKISRKKTVLIFSLHIPTGVDDPEQSKSYHLAKILEKDYANTRRIILAGDFNERYRSEPMQFLYQKGFKNPYKVLDMDISHSTSLSREENNGKVIDHILFKGIRVKKAGIIEEKNLSDHKPVWAIFKL